MGGGLFLISKVPLSGLGFGFALGCGVSGRGFEVREGAACVEQLCFKGVRG